MSNTVTLPWPPKQCSPNARVHHHVLAKAKAMYREMCFLMAKDQKLEAPRGDVLMRIDFYPPDKRRRDIDNMLASSKSGIDGVVQAIGIDDSIFKRCLLVKHDQVGGMVKISFLDAEQAIKVVINDSNL